MNEDEISDQEGNFVSICQNNNNNKHIYIINQDIEDLPELTAATVEKRAKLNNN